MAQSPPDRWFAVDKAKHFLLSWGVVAYVFSGSRVAGMDRRAATAMAITAGFGAGLGKELADRRGGKGISAKDLAWDAAGVLVAAIVMQKTK